MHPTLTIRPVTIADVPALAALRLEFRAAEAPAIEPADAFLERCRAWMAERLGGGRWRCWVAEAAGELHGNVWLQSIEKIPNPVAEPETHAYISNLYVRPALRGRRIGSRLLEAALAWCRGADVDSVILWPTPRSRTLYSRHGFEGRGDVMALGLAPPE